MFLTPHSRVITNVGIELPCSNMFSSKYKTYTNNWIAYTQDGIQETIPPKKFSWNDETKINFEYNMNQSFGIDKGIYDFDTINKFDEIQAFYRRKRINFINYYAKLKKGWLQRKKNR